jgi:hypothetical protein
MRAMAIHSAERAVAADVEIPGNARHGLLGNQEPVAVAMDADTSGNVFAAAEGGDVVPVVKFDEIATRREAVESGFDNCAIVTFDAQFFEQVLETRLSVRLLRDVGKQRGIGHIQLS